MVTLLEVKQDFMSDMFYYHSHFSENKLKSVSANWLIQTACNDSVLNDRKLVHPLN